MDHADAAAGPHALRNYVYSGYPHDSGMAGRLWDLV